MKITNEQARRLAICSTGLHTSPTGNLTLRDLLALIKFLGYVQQDPLQVVARAHDHILWSRNNQYRPAHLDLLLEKERLVFEHFCHDACVLPMDTLPYWKGQFKRKNDLFRLNKSRNNLLNQKDQKALLHRIKQEGPLCSRDIKSTKDVRQHAIWSKPAHKQTLDYLWLTGKLAVFKRAKFNKYYDLAERIYPDQLVKTSMSEKERLSWLIDQSLERLGFGTHAEIQQFWDSFTLSQTKNWCEQNKSRLTNVSIQSANGDYTKALMLPKQAKQVNQTKKLSGRLRIVNPFDPIVRDRNRLERLFGFKFRIEIYVPAAKRKYGYYVYPLLEYNKFVGRIEVCHDRQNNVLCVDNLWAEPNIAFGKGRMAKLASELERMRRFCNAKSVLWS